MGITNIDNLSRADALTNGDLFPVWQDENGDTRAVTAEQVKAYVTGQGAGVAPTDYTRIVHSPSASPFEFDIPAAAGHIWLIISPSEAMGAGTVNLPAVEDCVNGQELTISATFPITYLTLDGSGASILGEPTSIAADGYFRLRFDESLETWFRVG